MALTKVTNRLTQDAAANVKDFGAVGDGVTNDTTAIQAAINSGAKEVFIPEGTYVVTALTIANPVDIFGFGTLKKTTVTSAAIITITSSNVTIRDINIYGAGVGSPIVTTNSAENAIQVDGGSTPTQLENFRFENLLIDGVAGMGMRINYATRVFAHDNVIENCGYAGILFDSVADSSINGNKINEISGTGPNFYGISLSRDPSKTLSNAARTVNVVVSNNKVSNVNDWIGIDCHAAYKCVITNNTIYGCTYGINLQYDDAGATYEQPCEDIIVSENVIFGIGEADASNSRSGIICIGDNANGIYNANIRISNNVISESGFYSNAIGGIHIKDTKYAVIENNSITKSQRVGISILSGLSDSIIRNNHVNGVKAGSSSAFYLYVNYSSLSDNLIEGNKFFNSTGDSNYDPTYGIYYVTGGSGVVYSRNRMKDNTGANLYDGSSSNVYTDLEWQLESESIQFSATATGGAATESLGSKSGSFRRIPATSGTFIYRATCSYDVATANPDIAIRPNNGDIYTPLIYTVDGTNIPASAAITNVVYTLEGVYWED